MSDTSASVPRDLEPIDEAECLRLLGSTGLGRLAVMVGSRPDIFPVNYLVDHDEGGSRPDEIVIRTAEGTKLAAALMGKNVAFEIDEIDHAHQGGWSVVVHGTAHENRTLPGVMHDDELGVEPWASGEKNRHIRIRIEEITGRRLPPLAGS